MQKKIRTKILFFAFLSIFSRIDLFIFSLLLSMSDLELSKSYETSKFAVQAQQDFYDTELQPLEDHVMHTGEKKEQQTETYQCESMEEYDKMMEIYNLILQSNEKYDKNISLFEKACKTDRGNSYKNTITGEDMVYTSDMTEEFMGKNKYGPSYVDQLVFYKDNDQEHNERYILILMYLMEYGTINNEKTPLKDDIKKIQKQ
jgi:hypothetical protein